MSYLCECSESDLTFGFAPLLFLFIQIMDSLHLDCLQLIGNRLSIVDTRSLRLVCSLASKIKTPIFRDVFIERLLEHHIVPTIEEANEFCNGLFESGAYVSGSFILDCLYQTNFHCDLDVYDVTNNDGEYKPGTDNMKFMQYLYKSGFKNLTMRYRSMYNMRNYLHSTYPGNKTLEHSGHQFECCDTIQVIPIPMPIPKFVNSTFDLDLCKNIFNGNDLMVRDWNKLISRRDHIKPNTETLWNFYHEGYETVDDYMLDRMPSKSRTALKRIEKYRSRGFDIQTHPLFDEIEREINTVFGSHRYMIGSNIGFDSVYDKMMYITDGSINLDKYYHP